MKISISTFFFMLVAFFAFNTSATAQTCEPGLEQIPPIGVDDWLTGILWANQGNQIMANLETNPNTGVITGVRYVRSGFEQRSVKLCVYDTEGQLIEETNAFLPPGDAGSPVDTLVVLGLVTPIPVPSSYYIGAKFSGNGNWLLRKFDGAEGTRLRAGNLFNEPFHQDLSVMAGTIIEDGLYAIWAIVEDCVEPTVPGCTEQSACNYNPLATENDMTCDWSCLGGCERCDANGDGVINSVDLNAFLGVYGTPAAVGADLLDSNNDGVYTAADLLNIFGCFGQALSAAE